MGTVIPQFLCPADSRVFEAPILMGHPAAFTSYLGVCGTNFRALDGILFPDSRIRIPDVLDGLSNTIIVGERPPSPDLLLGWWYAGAGQNSFGSADMILGVREIRAVYLPLLLCPRGPYSFSAGSLYNHCDALHFWSLHSGGANFLFADGSVHFLAYSADSLMPALASRAGSENVTIPE
jgi:prepilin-type processing-associated H-X9-DG protein